MPKPRTPRPSDRAERFIQNVLAGMNHTEAAITAGYSPRGAKQTAYNLLRTPAVAQALERARQRIAKQYQVTAERTLREMAVVAYADLRHYTIDGRPIDWVGLTEDAPTDAMRAVKKVKRTVREVKPRGADPYTETQTEVEFWSKDTQLRNLGEYVKLFKENRLDDEPEDELTPEQRKERVLSLLKIAAKRRREAMGDKKAG